MESVDSECARVYEKTIERMEALIARVWPAMEGEKDVKVDFSMEDVRAAFQAARRV
jgi:exocyst complex component 1